MGRSPQYRLIDVGGRYGHHAAFEVHATRDEGLFALASVV